MTWPENITPADLDAARARAAEAEQRITALEDAARVNANMVAFLINAMQAAYLAGRIDPAATRQWIGNALAGPGLLPDDMDVEAWLELNPPPLRGAA